MPSFNDLCKNILVFIFVLSLDVKRPIRVLWAQNVTHLSLSYCAPGCSYVSLFDAGGNFDANVA